MKATPPLRVNFVTGSMDKLPYPRLEVRLRQTDEKTDPDNFDTYEYAWDYVLVIHPARNTDIRCNVGDEYGMKDVEYILNTSYSSGGPPRVAGDIPYRDGAHIKWDGEALNLPMFSIVNGEAVELDEH